MFLCFDSQERIYGTIPYRVAADGACLFNSISLALYGTEKYSYELRFRTALHMRRNPHAISRETLSKLYDRDISMLSGG